LLHVPFSDDSPDEWLKGNEWHGPKKMQTMSPETTVK
jgi:hypothetical protein